MKTTVVRLSICSCGFPLFEPHVKLGDEYEVDWSRQYTKGTMICGGCGINIPSTFIWTSAKGDAQGGWLPSEAFDL